MMEEWRDIKGFEGYYQVSNLGRVKSLPREIRYANGGSRKNDGGILTPRTKGKGYLGVSLSNDKEQVSKSVHRLVAEAFIPKPNRELAINHINGIKTDNRIENLEWTSYRENNLHAYHSLGRKAPMDGRTGKSSPYSKIVYQIQDGKVINTFFGVREAERITGIGSSHISKACRGIQKTAGGFRWQYAQ